MDTISSTVPLIPAPSSPLSLQFGVVYAPRIPTPPWTGFAVQTWEGASEVWAYDGNGAPVVTFRGPLVGAWRFLALSLRMDVAP